MGWRPALRKACANRRVVASAAIATLTLLVFLGFGNVLSFWFTDTDEFSLIQTSRIESPGDFVTVISSPFVGDLRTGDFYRPVSSLSYGLDYAIWGLDPFGYHLTDMLLHLAAAIMAFFLLRLMTGGRQAVAFLGAAIFAFNPLMVEVIPSSTRRQDVIAVVFLLLSLLLFLKHLDHQLNRDAGAGASRTENGLLVLSVMAYMFAQGAKETVFLFPFLLVFYLVVIAGRSDMPAGQRVLAALKKTAPYFVVLFLFLIVRTAVLGSFVGGYCCRDYGVYGGRLPFYALKIRDYYSDLVHPGGLVGQIYDPFPGYLEKTASIAAICAILLLGAMFIRSLVNRGREEGITSRLVRLGFLTAAILSLAGIAAYPFFASAINNLTQDVYDGNSDYWFWTHISFYVIQKNIPVDIYLYEARTIFIQALATGLFCFTGGYVLLRQADVIRKWVVSDTGRLAAFLLFWVVLPMAVFIPNSYAHYNGYISIFPASALMALIVVGGFHAARNSIGNASGTDSRALRLRQLIGGMAIAALVLALTFSIPTRDSYEEWNDSGRISQAFSEKLSQAAVSLPADTDIDIYNMPERIYSYQKEFNHPSDILYPVSYTEQSWVALNFPGNRMSVTVRNKVMLPNPPREILFGMQQVAGDKTDIRADYR